jgi:UPF0176 protein
MKYQVLLYYYYTPIEDPEVFATKHLKFCTKLGVLGRIIISKEGINGTLSGTIKQTETYMQNLKALPGFKDISFKIDLEDAHAFHRISVKVKNEIVNLGLDEDINPHEITGTYLEPKEYFKKLQDPNVVIVDARNDYEYDLGHFKNAIKPDIKNFRDIPSWFKKHKQLFEGKTVLTYCTGGVRCEKWSGFLKREGIEDVYQLQGGIVTYGKDPDVKGQLWDGQCYVFDSRISVPVNRINPTIVGKDFFTGEPCERYINCANPECNKKLLCSEANEVKYHGSCCDACRHHPMNRYKIKISSFN